VHLQLLGGFALRNKKILISSLSLNLLFLLLFGYIVMKIGGQTFIVNKISSVFSNNEENKKEFSNYHQDRVSLFQEKGMEVNSIVFVGDSLTDNNEWNESFAYQNIYNRAIGGDSTSALLDGLNTITKYKPEKIFLMIGINDFLLENKAKEEVLSNYKKIISEIKKESPDTIVYVQSVLPVNTQMSMFKDFNNQDVIWLNDQLKKLAEEDSLQYIDLFSLFANSSNELDPKVTHDGVHLNGKSYKLWEETIQEFVN
jgi:lysophospholipase L1-like esterase